MKLFLIKFCTFFKETSTWTLMLIITWMPFDFLWQKGRDPKTCCALAKDGIYAKCYYPNLVSFAWRNCVSASSFESTLLNKGAYWPQSKCRQLGWAMQVCVNESFENQGGDAEYAYFSVSSLSFEQLCNNCFVIFVDVWFDWLLVLGGTASARPLYGSLLSSIFVVEAHSTDIRVTTTQIVRRGGLMELQVLDLFRFFYFWKVTVLMTSKSGAAESHQCLDRFFRIEYLWASTCLPILGQILISTNGGQQYSAPAGANVHWEKINSPLIEQ